MTCLFQSQFCSATPGQPLGGTLMNTLAPQGLRVRAWELTFCFLSHTGCQEPLSQDVCLQAGKNCMCSSLRWFVAVTKGRKAEANHSHRKKSGSATLPGVNNKVLRTRQMTLSKENGLVRDHTCSGIPHLYVDLKCLDKGISHLLSHCSSCRELAQRGLA